jgi:hypothetical protein
MFGKIIPFVITISVVFLGASLGLEKAAAALSKPGVGLFLPIFFASGLPVCGG